MKKFILVVLVVMVATILFGCTSVSALTGDAQSDDFGSFGAKSASDLSIEDMLKYAIQDEYLARQEYESIMQVYGEIKPFSNIIKAEQKHIEMLEELYKVFGFEIPKDTALNHVVIPNSIEEALKTGVAAEINNIAMYDEFLKADLPDDIRASFIDLRDASVKHLQAFERGNSQGLGKSENATGENKNSGEGNNANGRGNSRGTGKERNLVGSNKNSGGHGNNAKGNTQGNRKMN